MSFIVMDSFSVYSHLVGTVNSKALSVLPGEAGLALDHHAVTLRVLTDAVDHLALRHRLRPVLQLPGGSAGSGPRPLLAHLDGV